jgi:acyl-CoA thioesterase
VVVSDLAEALTLRPTDDGHWLAFADPRYESTNAMFGGWTAAIALRGAMQSSNEAATPSAITINFVKLVEWGTGVLVRVHRVGGGRSIHHWRGEVVSAGDEGLLAYAMIVLSERRSSDGLTNRSCLTFLSRSRSRSSTHPARRDSGPSIDRCSDIRLSGGIRRGRRLGSAT